MRPRFTLGILYLLFFFCTYCVALVLPAMWDILQNTPVGPEQQRLAEQAAKATIQSRFHLIAALAVATTGAGMIWEFLPGMKQ